MTMEIEVTHSEGEVAEKVDKEQIIDYLANNNEVFFKSQQRGEEDLTKQEKTKIALEIYDKSKLSFLMRFGKFMQQHQLEFFQQFTHGDDQSDEISILLKELQDSAKKNAHINVRNRRYEALKRMIREDSYFSETEMMKRNPLLYEQLVGQYLTEEERANRDKITIDNEMSTLSKIILEGIDRADARIKQKQQEEEENRMTDDEDEEEEEEENMEIQDQYPDSHPVCSTWGEFDEPKAPPKKAKRKSKDKCISCEEQELLREEFVSLMYQDFLDGKDEDFDYNNVDNNDKYDNVEMKENDAEDEYFDSEEPETVDDHPEEAEESEDELDVYMSALNRHPAVLELSEDLQRL